MLQTSIQSIRALIVFTVITGVAYPLIVTGIAQVAFNDQANGSLIEKDGKVLGSRLIGQPFSDPKYFWSRLSATSPMPYNGAASSGSNLGPTNPALAVPGLCERIYSDGLWTFGAGSDASGVITLPTVSTAHNNAWVGLNLYVQTLVYREDAGLTAVLYGPRLRDRRLWVTFGDARDYDYKIAALYVLLEQARDEDLLVTSVDLRFGDRLSFN